LSRQFLGSASAATSVISPMFSASVAVSVGLVKTIRNA
jgi:hypothetical protein